MGSDSRTLLVVNLPNPGCGLAGFLLPFVSWMMSRLGFVHAEILSQEQHQDGRACLDLVHTEP